MWDLRGEPRFLNDPAASGVRSYEDLPIKNEVDEHRGDTDLPFFNLTTVVAATENFSSANMLGHGGFGTVYKVLSLEHFECLSIVWLQIKCEIRFRVLCLLCCKYTNT